MAQITIDYLSFQYETYGKEILKDVCLSIRYRLEIRACWTKWKRRNDMLEIAYERV